MARIVKDQETINLAMASMMIEEEAAEAWSANVLPQDLNLALTDLNAAPMMDQFGTEVVEVVAMKEADITVAKDRADQAMINQITRLNAMKIAKWKSADLLKVKCPNLSKEEASTEAEEVCPTEVALTACVAEVAAICPCVVGDAVTILSEEASVAAMETENLEAACAVTTEAAIIRTERSITMTTTTASHRAEAEAQDLNHCTNNERYRQS